ncbi:MAG: hypothetical protein WBY94_08165 [Polyangiaceae bacterium]
MVCTRRRWPALLSAAVSSAWPAAAQADLRACLDGADEGQKLRDSGAYLEARERFIACAADECPGEVRKGCIGWLGELDKLIPTVVFGARAHDKEVSDVRVTIDGVVAAERIDGKPVALDPGEHHFRFERAGDAEVDQTAVLMAGEKERPITVRFGTELPSLPPSVPAGQPLATGEARAPERKKPSAESMRAAAFALGAVGATTLVAGGVLDISGYVFLQECRGDRTCSGAHERAEVEWRFVTGDVLLGVAVLSSVAAWLVWPRDGRGSKVGIALVGVDPGHRLATLGLRGTF